MTITLLNSRFVVCSREEDSRMITFADMSEYQDSIETPFALAPATAKP